MPFHLSELLPTDLPSQVSIYHAAFASDPVHRTFFPAVTPEDEVAWLTQRFPRPFARPGMRHFKLVDADSGRIAGFCRWKYPHVLTAQQEAEKTAEAEKEAGKTAEDRMRDFPRGADPEICREFFGALDSMQAKWFDERDMYGEFQFFSCLLRGLFLLSFCCFFLLL